MKGILLMPILLLAAMMTTSVALAQPAPQFRDGFKAIADQIPNTVGQPLQAEQIAPNGDILQATTRGLMVWRKADRWNSFTDGSYSWILGPYGLQSRPNSESFAWEQPSPPNPAPLPAPQPVIPPPPLPPAPSQPASPPPAPTPAPLGSYTPDVKAMDDESGGHGVMVKNFIQGIDQEWGRVWGWHPRRPTTVYLYNDGYRMAGGAASILGLNLGPTDTENFAVFTAITRGNDLRTGGWAILMNLSYRYGQEDWLETTQSNLLMEYARIMVTDLANDAGPQWFREGFAQWSAFSKIWDTISEKSHTHYAHAFYTEGKLPSLMALTGNWNDIVGSGSEELEAAYGASHLAVKYLVGKVGGMPLLQTLQRTAAGESFDSALQNATGYSVARLDGEYKSSIPSS